MTTKSVGVDVNPILENGYVYDSKINNTRYWIIGVVPKTKEIMYLEQEGKNGKVLQKRDNILYYKNISLVGKCNDWAEAVIKYNSKFKRR
jgi:hypothetical protein